MPDISECEVSVIIPAYNAAQTIEFQLCALANQEDAPEFEVVVVDNKSTDATSSIVAALVEDLPYRTSIISAVARRSPGYARNSGAEQASGRIILFCDSDDIVRPDWVSSLTSTVRQYGAAAGYMAKFSEDASGYRQVGEVASARQFWLDNPRLPWPVSACLGVRRDIFDLVEGFDESIKSGEDIDFGMKLICEGVTMEQSSAVVEYRLRDSASSERRQLRAYAKADTLMQLRYADLLQQRGSVPPGIWADLRSVLGHVRRFPVVVRDYGFYDWGTWLLTRIARINSHVLFRLRRNEGRC